MGAAGSARRPWCTESEAPRAVHVDTDLVADIPAVTESPTKSSPEGSQVTQRDQVPRFLCAGQSLGCPLVERHTVLRGLHHQPAMHIS